MSDRIKILGTEVLHQSKYTLKNVTYTEGNEGKKLTREVYDRGDAAAILLYNKEAKTVVLTKQFRLPSFLNGNPQGVLIEACAGMLDQDDAEGCARREAEEETGLTDLVPWPDTAIRQVVIVRVPPGKGEPAHEHADIRFFMSTATPVLRDHCPT